MLKSIETIQFKSINRGYNSVFRPNRLSLGLVVPIEAYTLGSVPTMKDHIERVQLAEKLGFSAVWLRAKYRTKNVEDCSSVQKRNPNSRKNGGEYQSHSEKDYEPDDHAF